MLKSEQSEQVHKAGVRGGVRGMKVIIEAEPKEIAELVRSIQGPLKVKIKEPDASSVTKDFLTAIDDMLQARQS